MKKAAQIFCWILIVAALAYGVGPHLLNISSDRPTSDWMTQVLRDIGQPEAVLSSRIAAQSDLPARVMILRVYCVRDPKGFGSFFDSRFTEAGWNRRAEGSYCRAGIEAQVDAEAGKCASDATKSTLVLRWSPLKSDNPCHEANMVRGRQGGGG